jgi:hypothetical protein
LIGIIAAILTLLVASVLWGSNGSGAEGSTCTEIPAGRVPAAIICPNNDTPKNARERNCVPGATFQNVRYWTCRD